MKTIIVCGPTASGKTKFAVRLARRIGGEILSADSRQVYRGMDIGTGKDLCEYGDVRYHLIDVADPSRIYTLYDYQRDFFDAYRDVVSRGKVPIVCGGTGLYIEAVIKGYALPHVPENVEFRKSMMNKPREELMTLLEREDKNLFAKTDVSTKKRIVRALEIAKFGGGADCADKEKYPNINPRVFYIVHDRAKLRERIEARLRERLSGGMIEEVERIMKSGIDRERFAMFGMEYKHVGRYLDGVVGYDEMYAQLLQDIFHLAKRQDTWFRGMARRGISVFKLKSQ